jgi:hypothetical protein
MVSSPKLGSKLEPILFFFKNQTKSKPGVPSHWSNKGLLFVIHKPKPRPQTLYVCAYWTNIKVSKGQEKKRYAG